MAEPSILFQCDVCERVEGLPLDTLQLIGTPPWLKADDWYAERGGIHRVRCGACWEIKPMAAPHQVQEVTVRPREFS
jgi:hypothetical protein